VRTAKPTKEVPGGQATQSICLNKIGFRPTAMMPMFHHGIPDRQEIFLLSSIHKKNIGVLNTNKIPEVVGDDLEKEVFGVFWRKFFGSKPVFTDVKITEAPIPNLEAVVRGPIVEITNSATPNNIWEAVDNFFNENGRFALARLSLDLPPDQLSMASIQLRKTGFRLAGFEPVIKKDDISMDILFGKLSNEGKRVMVLPTLTEGVFTHEEESLLIKQSIIWRQN
jgi:hypothetical protein